jgi:hypothetical protein
MSLHCVRDVLERLGLLKKRKKALLKRKKAQKKRKKAQKHPRSAASLRRPCEAIFAEQKSGSATFVPRENATRESPSTFSMTCPFCPGAPPRRDAWTGSAGVGCLGPWA